MSQRKTFFLLALLTAFAAFLSLGKISPVRAEDEMDEEIKSTISSDPVNRGGRPKPSKSKSEPAASTGGDDEGGEWQTMHSETHRGARSSGGWMAPSSINVDLEKKQIFTPKISFGSNSDQPTPQSMSVLKQVASVLAKRTDLSVRIEGHTDSIGYDQPNLELSQKRADRVRDILAQDGVATAQLQSVGMGDRYPIASSSTSEGQEKNRRVEFHITEMAAAAPVPAAPSPAPAPVAPAPPPTPAPVAPPPMMAAPSPFATPPVQAPMMMNPAPAPAPMSPPMAAPAPAPAPAPKPVAPAPAPQGP